MNLIILLILYILTNHFAIYANGAYKISSCPNVHSPILLSKLWKLFAKVFGTFTFQYFHDIRRRMLGRNRQIHVNMIAGNCTLYYLDIFPFTQFRQYLLQTRLYLFYQNLIPILWHPDKMIFTPIGRMRRFLVTFHWRVPLNILVKATLAQSVLANNVGLLKEWGLRPHTPPLTMSVDLS